MVVVVLLVMMILVGFASVPAQAQYSDSIDDSTDDVDYWRVTDNEYEWKENVERPDIDIVRASIEKSGGDIQVELEVKGSVRNESELWYTISLEDEEGEAYNIHIGQSMYGGTCHLGYPNGGKTLDEQNYSGFGTSTFTVSFSLDEVGNPASLEITSVGTYDWLEAENQGEYYYDEAEPGTSTSGSSDGPSSGSFPVDVAKWGMLCIALAVIIPILIIVLIVVVIVKVIGGEDEGQEPQKRYQQPPPGQQGQQQQQQPPSGQQQQNQPPPPGDQSDQTPPPPDNESDKEW